MQNEKVNVVKASTETSSPNCQLGEKEVIDEWCPDCMRYFWTFKPIALKGQWITDNILTLIGTNWIVIKTGNIYDVWSLIRARKSICKMFYVLYEHKAC